MKKKNAVVKPRKRGESVTKSSGNLFINIALVLAAISTGIFLLYPNSVIKGKKTISSVLSSKTTNKVDSYVGNNLSGDDWKTPEKVQDALEHRLFGSLKSITEEGVRDFAEDNQRRLELAQWMFADAALKADGAVQQKLDAVQKQITKTEQKIAAIKSDNKDGSGSLTAAHQTQVQRLQEQLQHLRKELAYPHTLREALKQPGAIELMETIGNNLAWLQQMLYTGELVRPGEVISILNHLRRIHPGILTGKMERNIATATALEFARSGWGHDAAVERADFYIRNWKKGALNVVFDTLPFWELRMVCGCKGDHDFGSVESMQWSLDNVHLPADEYPDCQWRCGYKMYNPYGESVFGEGYVEPFSPMYGRNAARFAYEVGGVCGSLSHFGAFAALANGIPAMTAEEPGYCSFIVKVGDKWVPSYSLSWERDLHWSMWQEVHAYSALLAATEMQTESQKKQTQLSEVARSLAWALAEHDVSGAASMYEVALHLQPLNYQVWRDYVHFMQSRNPLDKPGWEKLHSMLCEKLVPVYPELAAELCKLHLYGALKTVYADDAAQMNRFVVEFWDSVVAMKPDRWHVEGMMDAQLSLFSVSADQKQQKALFDTVLKAVAHKKDYAPVVLAKGADMMKDWTESQQKEMLASMVQLLGASDSAKSNELVAPIILAAERQEDLNAFHSINAMVNRAETKKPDAPIPAFEPMSGNLVSQDALIRASSTCEWDDVCAHRCVLLPEGGLIHTASEANPWIMVRLSKMVQLTGVVLVTTTKNMDRCANMKIQVSETGKDGDWHDVAQLGTLTDRVVREDLSKDNKKALYVRVLRSDGPEFFHLNGFYVYGTPAS